MATFAGVPADAVTFFAELEENNNRPWWLANKARFEASVRAPMVALGESLAEEFGDIKVFRPHRDVRFSLDKSPYKTHQGVVVATAPTIGYYVQVSADGLLVAGGWWQGDSRTIAAYRRAVDGAAGADLEARVAELVRAGFSLDADRMATRPKGIAADHPRLELLRARTLTLARHDLPPAWLDDPAYEAVVRERWRALRPVIDWLTQHLAQ